MAVVVHCKLGFHLRIKIHRERGDTYIHRRKINLQLTIRLIMIKMTVVHQNKCLYVFAWSVKKALGMIQTFKLLRRIWVDWQLVPVRCPDTIKQFSCRTPLWLFKIPPMATCSLKNLCNAVAHQSFVEKLQYTNSWGGFTLSPNLCIQYKFRWQEIPEGQQVYPIITLKYQTLE